MAADSLSRVLALAALDKSDLEALSARVDELAEVGFKPEIVTELPEEGNDHTLYLVLESEPGEDPWYQEYLWLDNEWEKIGTTSIDFEDYYTKDEVNGLIDDASTQYTTMPVASVDNLGQVIQYTGVTNNNYTNGCFYECISDGGQELTYSWRMIDITEDLYYIRPNDVMWDYTRKQLQWAGYRQQCLKAGKFVPVVLSLYIFNVPYSTILIPYVDNGVLKGFGGTFNCKTNSGGPNLFTGCIHASNLNINGIENIPTSGFVWLDLEGGSPLFGNNTAAFTPTGDYNPATKKYVDDSVSTKQDTLVSGTNIKTINGTSVLGSGDINTNDIPIVTASFRFDQSQLNWHTSFTIATSAFSDYFDACDAAGKRLPFILQITNSMYYYWGLSFYVVPTICRASAPNDKGYQSDIQYEEGSYYQVEKFEDIDRTAQSVSFEIWRWKFQPELVSGSNIKTINNESLLGNGNLTIEGQTIQVDTIPTAGVDELGNIYQYVGTTTGDYINGYFYECVSDGEQEPTYSWVRHDTQPNKYVIDNNCVTYFVRGGQYNINTTSMTTQVSVTLPYVEVKEAIELAQKNNKKLNLLVIDYADINTIVFSGSIVPPESNTTYEMLGKTISSDGNVWATKLLIAYTYASGEVTITSIKRVGYTLLNIGVRNSNTYDPYYDSYNPATAKYAESMTLPIAPRYNKTSSYAVGDYVTQYNKLYKCNTAISGGENWNESHWTETKVVNEMGGTVPELVYYSQMQLIPSPGNNSHINFQGSDLAGYNQACLDAGRFIPIFVNVTLFDRGCIIYPRLNPANNKLQFFGQFVSPDENLIVRIVNNMDWISNPVLGELTTIDFWFRTVRFLPTTNTTTYTPTADYHPATKKYVDDAVAGAGGGLPTVDFYDLDPTLHDLIIDNYDNGINSIVVNAENFGENGDYFGVVCLYLTSENSADCYYNDYDGYNCVTIALETDPETGDMSLVYGAVNNVQSQYYTMPTASADYEGKIVQYIGTTTNTYTNGYFYKCVNNSGTYSWSNIGVQDVPTGDGRLLTAKIDYNVNLIFTSGTTFNYSSYPALKVLYDKIIEYNGNGTSFNAVVRFGGNNNFRELYFNYIMFGSQLVFVGYDSNYVTFFQLYMSADSATARKVYTAYTNDSSNIGEYYSFLTVNNTATYTPTGDYNPATKKYADERLESIAPAYSASATYAVGDYVSYQGKLYKCNTAITVAEAWTAAHWTETTTMTEAGGSQHETMPSASAGNVGEIIQYTGPTTIDYTNGYFYKCVEDSSTVPSTYSWEIADVQDWSHVAFWTDYTGEVIEATIDLSNYLAKDNTTAFTPIGDYNPATKKYVDDQIGAINAILATLTTPSDGGDSI